MKRILPLLLCLALVGGCVCAGAETAQEKTLTLGENDLIYTVTLTVPKGYRLLSKEREHIALEGLLMPDNARNAAYMLTIAPDGDYAAVESLAALEEDALQALIAADQEDGAAVTVKTAGGMRFLCIQEAGAKKNTYHFLETILGGCAVQLTLAPEENNVIPAMTEKQVTAMMDFLATLTIDAPPAALRQAALEAETPQEVPEAAAEPEEEPAQTIPLLASWTLSDAPAPRLTEEEQALFQQAAADSGMTYQPIAVVATQVVSGMNYAYLCRDAQGDQDWLIVTLYRSAAGETTLRSAHILALNSLETAEEAPETGLAGGWAIKAPENESGSPLPEEAQRAFTQALEDTILPLSPIALLGTQTVSGTNYRVLCQDESALYVADVYAPLEGSALLLRADWLNLPAYVEAK